MANCSRIVRDSAMVTMDSLYETSIALSNGTIADPLRSPLSPKLDPKCTQRAMSTVARFLRPLLVYVVRRDAGSVFAEQSSASVAGLTAHEFRHDEAENTDDDEEDGDGE